MNLSSLLTILPELVLTAAALLLCLMEPFVAKGQKWQLGYFSIGGLIASGLVLIPLTGREMSGFNGMVMLDSYAIFFKALALFASAIVILISLRYIQIEKMNMGEYYALILFATIGMMLTPATTDLIAFYLSLELMSISFYVLIAIKRTDPKSLEAGIKYFLTGIFTSGLILYGIAFLYGITGTTHVGAIHAYLMSHDLSSDSLLLFAIILITAGFGFKIAAVPFHMWAPDVYEGAPTPIAAFLSTGSKVAAFAAMLRIFMTGFIDHYPDWWGLIWLIAVLTMTMGNLVALVQSNLKRLLAYSSIGHAGYILMGLAVGSNEGMVAVLVYSAVYLLMTLGAFTMVVLLCRKHCKGDQISDFRGLARTDPWIAGAFVLFALSLTGIPPTAGFIGKLFLFSAAIQRGFYWLAIVGALNSVVSLYYYFKVVVVMYMQDPQDGMEPLAFSKALVVALAIVSFGTIFLGIYPEPLIQSAVQSVKHLL